MNRLELRPAARADLIHIWESGAERWGEDAADRYLRELVDELAMAAGAPLRGSQRGFDRACVNGMCAITMRISW